MIQLSRHAFAVLALYTALCSVSIEALSREAPDTTLCAAERLQLGCYRAGDGQLRNADSAYEAMFAGLDSSHLRASIEMAISLSIGTLWYWLDREHNLADWDYPSFKQRFTAEIWRYDNNSFAINWIFHPLSGAAFHALARGNEISVPWAAAYSFLTSMVWEYVLEFREKISINDVLVTPGAGITIGEFAHKLGLYLNSAPVSGRNWSARALRHALRWALGWHVAGHRALDGKPAPDPAETDWLGYDAQLWHRFQLGYSFGVFVGSDDGDSLPLQHSLHATGELISIPGFLREGRFDRGLRNADFTSITLSLLLAGGDTGFDLYSDTVLYGYYTQSITRRGSGLGGYGLLVGTSIAYRYMSQRAPFRDRLGLLHFPGVAANLYLVRGIVRAQLKLRGHLDFAGVHSSAFADWVDAHPGAVAKSILRKQGYSYDWGGSGRLSAELEVSLLEFGGELFFGWYNSDEGLDRSQATVTADVRGADSVLGYRVWLRLSLGLARLRLELSARGRQRTSKLEQFKRHNGFHELTVGLFTRL